MTVILREVTIEDFPVFFEHGLDPEANRMAAFTRKDPSDREAFNAYWKRNLSDPTNVTRTILFAGRVAGSVAKYEIEGEAEITYWIGREFWGLGIATEALSQFLKLIPEWPIHARAAQDNLGSIRVLEKCGFSISGHESGFANARGEETAEVVMLLEAPKTHSSLG